MTKQTQAKKNIQYSGELMNYLISNKIKTKPNSSYVIFIENQIKLNKMNQKLVKELQNEGKKVIKATKTKNRLEPWKFISA